MSRKDASTKYLLSRPEGLELLAQLFLKWPDGTFSPRSFESAAKISQMLRQTTEEKRKFANEIAKAAFPQKPREDQEEPIKHSAAIYHFALALKQRLSVTLSKEVYDGLIKWINTDVDVNRQYMPRVPAIVMTETMPEKQFRIFQDTWWFQYHYEYWPKEDPKTGNFVLVHGVVRQILHMQRFGKIDLYAKNYQKTGGDQDYHGEYDISPRTDKHLNIRLVMGSSKAKQESAASGDKVLSIKFYIGSEKLTHAVGIYNNAGNAMYAGQMLMEKGHGEIDRSKIGFFPFREPNEHGEVLDRYIYDFFAYPANDLIQMPNTITSKGDVLEFIRKREIVMDKL